MLKRKWPILYKRAVNGKVSQWQVEVEGDKFHTISGYVDGEKVISAWTVCFPKNEGKKNATTAAEQAIAEADAMHEKRKATGYWENIDDIDTSVYFEPMLAKDWDKEKSKIKYPIYSQPKLDGMRCIVRADGMWSRNGKKVLSAPHIFKALQPLFEANPDLILDGELFAERSVTDFNTIISCVRKTKPTAEDLVTSAKFIEYWIYDVPSVNDVFGNRYKYLLNMDLPKYCKITPTFIVNNEKEVNTNYTKFMQQEFEGQILRVNAKYENKRSKYLLKHKTFVDADFEILGVIEGKGNMEGKVGKLCFKMPDGEPFEAAVNGTWEYLEELLKRRDLIGKIATVKYFELTEYGVPRFPKVVEIRDYE